MRLILIVMTIKEKEIYSAYTPTPEWRYKKNEAFKLFGRKCQRCDASEKIEVHHKTYDRIGAENVNTDLAILCEDCHDLYHMSYSVATISTTNAFINLGTKYIFTKRKKFKKRTPRSFREGEYEENGVYYIKGKRFKKSGKNKKLISY